MAAGTLRNRAPKRAVNRAGRVRRRAPEASRDAILDAALRCFAKRGYHETSVDDIAARARLSKGAVYWHFSGKRALFLALLDRALEHDRELARAARAAPDWRAALHEMFSRSPAYVERELPLVKLSIQHLLQSGFDEGLRTRAEDKQERWNAIVEEKLARGVADGVVRPFTPSDVTLAIGAAVAGLTLFRLTRPELPLDSVWRAVEEIFDRGLSS
ncbi:MAG TPA: helix-turn-helix domain-containing protein [Myxococcota bacterium]|nr:helix-turn-helix domain-containing protein [Myxococcota bacterium]